jgi:hypothetical protein
VPEADAIPFSAGQEHHGLTADQFDLCEVDRDDMVFLQRCAKDIQAFPGNPTADVKNDTVFKRKSVDSARHGRVACCPMPQWQTSRQAQLSEKAANTKIQSLANW